MQNEIIDWRRFDGDLNPELRGLTYLEMLQLITMKASHKTNAVSDQAGFSLALSCCARAGRLTQIADPHHMPSYGP